MKTPVSACALALALSATLPCLGATDIFRCAERGGGVTYQQMPCPEASVGQRANVPTEFPPPDTVERDRLFAREEALYRRLEAQRDRDMQEAVLRDAAQERSLERARLAAMQEMLSQQPTGYFVGYPLRAPRLHPHAPVRRAGPIQ